MSSGLQALLLWSAESRFRPAREALPPGPYWDRLCFEAAEASAARSEGARQDSRPKAEPRLRSPHVQRPAAPPLWSAESRFRPAIGIRKRPGIVCAKHNEARCAGALRLPPALGSSPHRDDGGWAPRTTGPMCTPPDRSLRSVRSTPTRGNDFGRRNWAAVGSMWSAVTWHGR